MIPFFSPSSAVSGKSQEGPREGVKSRGKKKKTSVIPEKLLCGTPGPRAGRKGEKSKQ